MLDLPITEITFSRNLLSCANIDAKKVLDSLEENDCRKRRRLDDFTPQEKLIRRKLKNRVAAQSARDRKKERMTELEEIVGRLEVQNNQLKSSNEELQANMKFLLDQNKELRTKLGMDDSHSPEMKGDHTYTLKRKLDDTSMDQENGLDSKHIMVKEEEGFEFEHAEENANSTCFINNDVVIESQTDQVLDLLKQIETGESFENNASEEIGSKIEGEVQQNFQTDTITSSNEPDTDISSLSVEEAEELLSICQEITDLVGQPDDSVTNDTNIKLDHQELLQHIPDELISTESNNIFDEFMSFDYEDLGYESFLDESSSSKDDTWPDVFSDLFPSLSHL